MSTPPGSSPTCQPCPCVAIYATGLEVTPPAGQEVFLVMASSGQPLGGVRAPREAPASYAASLRQGLSQRDVRVDAAAVVVDTLRQ